LMAIKGVPPLLTHPSPVIGRQSNDKLYNLEKASPNIPAGFASQGGYFVWAACGGGWAQSTKAKVCRYNS
ncbi:MAG: hypothetical protein ABI024_07255, partial [Vicinamibacterales bacterium]